MTEPWHNVADYADRQVAFIKKGTEYIEQGRKEHERKGMVFTSLTPEQLHRKLKRSNGPMIISQGWTQATPVGGAVNYSVGISNPDPVDYGFLFVHVFIGPANIAPDVDEAVVAVDGRFARLTKPQFPGLIIKTGAFEQVDFEMPVPAVEKSNYLGNSFLFQAAWHDPATYFDRGLFVFEVT
jgi:hypothetical protein